VGQERIALLVGLFCMENFEHGPLMDGLVRGVFGLEPHDVERFEIKKGMFRAISKGKAYEVPIKETDRFAMKGCAPCFDFVAELADVSVGSVGSPGGWSTVLTRTDLGHELYSSALAAGALEERPIQEKGLALANRLAGDKARRFQERSEGMKDFGVKR
jgi:coenzyme F420 hydrogenase subunit beta